MIDKETLLKKIENEATIYYLAGEELWDVALSKENCPELKTDGNLYTHKIYNTYRYKMYLNNLFATKEDAEWAFEFGNITRTEKLELPTWGEFKKTHTTINFYKNGCEYGLHRVNYSADRNNPDFKIEVYVVYNDLEESSDDLFSEPLTKENYIKACRLCKKLFLGGAA